MSPHAPAGHAVSGWQQAVPLHTWPAGQPPQLSVPPQPSETEPQLPAGHAVSGVQQNPEAQTWPDGHAQLRTTPQLSVIPPQREPHPPLWQHV